MDLKFVRLRSTLEFKFPEDGGISIADVTVLIDMLLTAM